MDSKDRSLSTDLLDNEQAVKESAPDVDREGHPTRHGLLVFCPHRVAEAVTVIQPAELLQRGIKGIILDLDNTLVRWSSEELTEEIVGWIQSLREAGLKLCLLSNSVISRRVFQAK